MHTHRYTLTNAHDTRTRTQYKSYKIHPAIDPLKKKERKIKRKKKRKKDWLTVT